MLETNNLKPMALGCWLFEPSAWQGPSRTTLLRMMDRALELGIRHFDTASDYGRGESEKLLGEFLKGKRERVFLASKANPREVSAKSTLEHVNESLERLNTDVIDLYYIHWPRRGKDMRPVMEGLVKAKEAGKIRGIGVSNFSLTNMQEVSEVGKIDVHQLGYNFFWRLAEDEVIPYCQAKGIEVVTYSSIAQGILTGKFAQKLNLPASDQRNGIVFFQEDVWPYIYGATEELKGLAESINQPLVHLAIRWVIHQQGIHTAIVGAKNEAQMEMNAAALEADIPETIFEQMTEISNRVAKHIPKLSNMYDYNP